MWSWVTTDASLKESMWALFMKHSDREHQLSELSKRLNFMHY